MQWAREPKSSGRVEAPVQVKEREISSTRGVPVPAGVDLKLSSSKATPVTPLAQARLKAQGSWPDGVVEGFVRTRRFKERMSVSSNEAE